jgi:hypothetical protein
MSCILIFVYQKVCSLWSLQIGNIDYLPLESMNPYEILNWCFNINTRNGRVDASVSLNYKNTMIKRITMETVACLRSKCHLKQNLIPSWPWSFQHTGQQYCQVCRFGCPDKIFCLCILFCTGNQKCNWYDGTITVNSELDSASGLMYMHTL